MFWTKKRVKDFVTCIVPTIVISTIIGMFAFIGIVEFISEVFWK